MWPIVNANLALSLHIWPPTWPQLNPFWRKIGMTSPILGQSSPPTSASWSHFGPSNRQGTILEQILYDFGTILVQFWDHFGTIWWGFMLFLLTFQMYFMYFAIRYPTRDIDKYTTTSKRFCESINFLPWGRRQRRQPSDILSFYLCIYILDTYCLKIHLFSKFTRLCYTFLKFSKIIVNHMQNSLFMGGLHDGDPLKSVIMLEL